MVKVTTIMVCCYIGILTLGQHRLHSGEYVTLHDDTRHIQHGN